MRPLNTPRIIALKILGVVTVFGVIALVAVYNGWFNFEFSKGQLSTYLQPARDLRGTWVSSLAGKGMQVSGQFNTQGTSTTVYEDGDIELIIDNVADGLATGTMRYYNVCAWGFSIMPKLGKVNVPRTCIADTGPSPIAIKVSSSSLDFGTVTAASFTATMSGSFTTDLIHGNMTATVAPYGNLKGVFNLIRKN